MPFSSDGFLFIFLPFVILLHFLWRNNLQRNIFLAIVSLIFYAIGGGAAVLILIFSIVFNWLIGLLLLKHRRKGLLIFGIAGNLSVLGWFKYANFLVTQINLNTRWTGLGIEDWQDVALPIGVSFFTFQGISYLVDIWRGDMPPLRNIFDFAFFKSFFPQLIAGPIVRVSDLGEQIRHRQPSVTLFEKGAGRFCLGLAKKVLIADLCGRLADQAFALPPDQLTTIAAWIAVFAYTLQIYFDFSGYSDMAIGMGLMFGIRLPENFNHPYGSVSITEFWRRWHMTLSRWFRDYVYIPLGGNRGGPLQTYRNLAIVFALTGFWHGANWTFLFWGAWHGAWLMIERVSGLAERPTQWWHGPRRLLTIFVVMLGWVVFRAPDIDTAGGWYRTLFGLYDYNYPVYLWMHVQMLKYFDLPTILAMTIGLISFFKRDRLPLGELLLLDSRYATALRIIFICIILPVVLMQVLVTKYSPFLYFQF